jgi:hypothetical protein
VNTRGEVKQKYVNTKTLLKDVVFEEAHGLMAGSSASTGGDNNSGGGPLPVGGDTEVDPDDGD